MNKQDLLKKLAQLSLSMILIAPLISDVSLAENIKVDFQICAESKNWIRPNSKQQKNHLNSFNSPYDQETINQLGGQFWKYNIMSFTSYGGSAFFDYTNLSGLWSVKKASKWQCASEDIIAINDGKKARIWVLSHQVISINWDGNKYIMTVKPTKKGVQVIHLNRSEQNEFLPLKVFTENGKKIPVLPN